MGGEVFSAADTVIDVSQPHTNDAEGNVKQRTLPGCAVGKYCKHHQGISPSASGSSYLTWSPFAGCTMMRYRVRCEKKTCKRGVRYLAIECEHARGSGRCVKAPTAIRFPEAFHESNLSTGLKLGGGDQAVADSHSHPSRVLTVCASTSCCSSDVLDPFVCGNFYPTTCQ